MFDDEWYDNDYDVIRCSLSNEDNAKTTAFIPAKFAVAGKLIRINEELFKVETVIGKPISYQKARYLESGSIRKAGYGTQNLDLR